MKTKRHCLSCGRDITVAEWQGLPSTGMQCLPAEEPGERDMRLEWRRCPCGNSLAVDLEDPDFVLFAVLAASREVAA